MEEIRGAEWPENERWKTSRWCSIIFFPRLRLQGETIGFFIWGGCTKGHSDRWQERTTETFLVRKVQSVAQGRSSGKRRVYGEVGTCQYGVAVGGAIVWERKSYRRLRMGAVHWSFDFVLISGLSIDAL